jgi:hypothetical protein
MDGEGDITFRMQSLSVARTVKFDERVTIHKQYTNTQYTNSSRVGRLVSVPGGDVSESCRGAVSAGARRFHRGLVPFFGSRCEETRRTGGTRRSPERAGGLARAAGGRSSAAPNTPSTVPFQSVVDVGCPGPDSRRRRPTCDQPILERPPTRPVY